jgi:hypothetical protein
MVVLAGSGHGQEESMTTTTPPEGDARIASEPSAGTKPKAGMWLAIGVLSVLVLILGAWIIIDQVSGSGSDVPEDIDALIDDYLAAWETRDEAAMRDLVTTDFVVNEYFYQASIDRSFLTMTLSDDLEGMLAVGFSPSRPWTTEQVGDPIIVGEGPWFVAVGENWILEGQRADGMAHYVVVEEGGRLLIANHYWAGEEYLTE